MEVSAAAVVQVVAPADDLEEALAVVRAPEQEEALVSAAAVVPAVAEDSAEAQAVAVASVVGSEVHAGKDVRDVRRIDDARGMQDMPRPILLVYVRMEN